MGLAQHNGLPTRLLDLSFNPLVAAYFAAKNCVEGETRDQSGGKELCVWVLRKMLLDAHQLLAGRSGPTLVTVPTATNARLHAQEGLFVVRMTPVTRDQPVDRRPLEEVFLKELHPRLTTRVRERVALNGQLEEDFPYLIRVRLPGEKARELLWTLAQLGVSAAKLYPGLQGVVEAMREEETWSHLANS